MYDPTARRQHNSAFDCVGERTFASERDDGRSRHEAGQRLKSAGKAADRSNRGGQCADYEWDQVDSRPLRGVDADNCLKGIESVLRNALFSLVALTGAVTGWLAVSLAMEWF